MEMDAQAGEHEVAVPDAGGIQREVGGLGVEVAGRAERDAVVLAHGATADRFVTRPGTPPRPFNGGVAVGAGQQEP